MEVLVSLLGIITFQLVFPLAERSAQSSYLLLFSIDIFEFKELIHCGQNPLVVSLTTHGWILDLKTKF